MQCSFTIHLYWSTWTEWLLEPITLTVWHTDASSICLIYWYYGCLLVWHLISNMLHCTFLFVICHSYTPFISTMHTLFSHEICKLTFVALSYGDWEKCINLLRFSGIEDLNLDHYNLTKSLYITGGLMETAVTRFPHYCIYRSDSAVQDE